MSPQLERRRARFIRELDAWPRRDGVRAIGHQLWSFRGPRATSGNLIVMQREWQVEHWRDA